MGGKETGEKETGRTPFEKNWKEDRYKTIGRETIKWNSYPSSCSPLLARENIRGVDSTADILVMISPFG